MKVSPTRNIDVIAQEDHVERGRPLIFRSPQAGVKLDVSRLEVADFN